MYPANGHESTLGLNLHSARTRWLQVALSNTDGHNWTRVAMLEAGDDKHYFHYPTLAQDGCRLLVAYS
eukprot:7704995-Pyramimonas_sp.AAC.1